MSVLVVAGLGAAAPAAFASDTSTPAGTSVPATPVEEAPTTELPGPVDSVPATPVEEAPTTELPGSGR